MKYFYLLVAMTAIGCASAPVSVQSPNVALSRQDSLGLAIHSAVEKQECFDSQMPSPHCRQCLSQP
jgi:hypothetical protein